MTKKEKINMEGIRVWSVLIPRIEGILKADITSEYKCVLIEYEIQRERNRDS